MKENREREKYQSWKIKKMAEGVKLSVRKIKGRMRQDKEKYRCNTEIEERKKEKWYRIKGVQGKKLYSTGPHQGRAITIVQYKVFVVKPTTFTIGAYSYEWTQ